MVVGFIIIVPITTKVVSLNPAHDEVYVLDIALYGRPVGFSGCSVSTTNKTDRHDITEILLKVGLIKHHILPFITGVYIFFLYILYLPFSYQKCITMI